MVNINLLPWREQALLYQKKTLIKMIMCTLVLIFLMNIVIHLVLSHEINTVRDRLAIVKTKIQALTHARKPEQIKVPYTFWGKLFVEIGKAPLTRVCLTGLEGHGQTVLFKGRARTISDFTEFLRTWNAGYLFKEIRIRQIEPDKNAVMQFVFEGKQ